MRRVARRSFGAGLVAAVAGLSVAGVAPATALVSAKTPKACDLLTPQVAAQALGGPVNPPVATKPNPHTTICKYTRTDGQAFGHIQVSDWSFLNTFGGVQQEKKGKIPGVGDQAYDLGSTFGVAVKKGSVGFIVNLSLGVGEFTGAAADQLAASETQADISTAKVLVASLGAKKKK
jgi:hypothetical protein